MSYYVPYLDEAGIHIPTYDDLMEYMLEGYRVIFGNDAYIGQETQAYQLLSLFCRAWEELSFVVFDAYNSRNPDWASGAALDTLCALNGISRKSASPSRIRLELTGTPGKELAAGQLVRDGAGYSWQTIDNITFDSDGNATVTAACTIDGDIDCTPGSASIIETPDSDWFTAINVGSAVLGMNAETDVQLRTRRRLSVALPSQSLVESLSDTIANTKGVERVKVIDNRTNIIDENGTEGHSVQCIVDGGTSEDIAKSVYIAKAPGIGTTGLETGRFVDEFGVTKEIKYQRPIVRNTTINIVLRKTATWEDGNTEKIKGSIVEYAKQLNIGESLIVPILYSVVYNSANANDFVVMSIDASAGGGASPSILQAGYRDVFDIQPESINISFS